VLPKELERDYAKSTLLTLYRLPRIEAAVAVSRDDSAGAPDVWAASGTLGSADALPFG